MESKAIMSAPNSDNFSTSLNKGVIIIGCFLLTLFLMAITGKFKFFFISFKFLNPSILKALAPPIIEAFAEAKTKEGLSSGPLGTGWHEAISDFLKLFKII